MRGTRFSFLGSVDSSARVGKPAFSCSRTPPQCCAHISIPHTHTRWKRCPDGPQITPPGTHCWGSVLFSYSGTRAKSLSQDVPSHYFKMCRLCSRCKACDSWLIAQMQSRNAAHSSSHFLLGASAQTSRAHSALCCSPPAVLPRPAAAKGKHAGPGPRWVGEVASA